jgi:hypothetical protein
MKQPLDDKSRIKDCTNSSTLNYPISVATNWFYFVFFLFFLLLILRANTLDFSSHELQLINVNQGSWHELFTQCAKEKTAPLPVHFLLRISQFLGQQTIHTRLPFLLLNLLFLILCFKKIILHFNNKLTLRFCLLLLLIPSVTTLFVGLTIIPFVLLLYYLLFPLLLKESIINLKSQFLITILATLIQPMLAIPVLLLLWFQSKTSFNWRTVIMGILSC